MTIHDASKSTELIVNPVATDKKYPGSSYILPSGSLEITLADTRSFYERSQYTLFTLMGDFGGFNAAIIALPAFFMNFYTARMF